VSGDRVTVSAPAGYANALLNGSSGIIVHRYRNREAIDTVLLLDGPESGREWQFNPDHLRPTTI
jgi:hypothetical protein